MKLYLKTWLKCTPPSPVAGTEEERFHYAEQKSRFLEIASLLQPEESARSNLVQILEPAWGGRVGSSERFKLFSSLGFHIHCSKKTALYSSQELFLRGCSYLSQVPFCSPFIGCNTEACSPGLSFSEAVSHGNSHNKMSEKSWSAVLLHSAEEEIDCSPLFCGCTFLTLGKHLENQSYRSKIVPLIECDCGVLLFVF